MMLMYVVWEYESANIQAFRLIRYLFVIRTKPG